MEEDDAFVPYLASLLEVSIVEDSVSTVALSEAGGKNSVLVFVGILKLFHALVLICSYVNFESFYFILLESAKQSDGTEENNTINVNGVAVSNPESSSKVNSTDVPCPHVDEQDEVQGKFICI
jgi:hypothetical protein